MEQFLDFFPGVLKTIMENILPRRRNPAGLDYSVTEGFFGKVGGVIFWLEGDSATVRKKWATVGVALDGLVEGLSDDVARFLAKAAVVRWIGPFPPAFTQ